MAKKITIVNPALSSENRAKINETAEKYGYFTEFFQSNQEALPHLQETEIIFGMGADLIKAAPQLRWFCSHTAGVDNYMEPGLFRDDSVLLSNSSGAYGVTLAEHTVMVTLMLLRRELEYSHIVEERKWIKNLSFRSLYGSRISILGTGDLGRTIASRFQGFHPARILGFNHSGRKSSDVFTESLPIAQLDSYLPKTDILISCLCIHRRNCTGCRVWVCPCVKGIIEIMCFQVFVAGTSEIGIVSLIRLKTEAVSVGCKNRIDHNTVLVVVLSIPSCLSSIFCKVGICIGVSIQRKISLDVDTSSGSLPVIGDFKDTVSFRCHVIRIAAIVCHTRQRIPAAVDKMHRDLIADLLTQFI